METLINSYNPNLSLMGLGAAGAMETLIAKGSTVNVREQPSTTSKILRTVKKGEVIGTVEESFISGGDAYRWYALNGGGFIREDVVTVSAGGAKSNGKSFNPWMIGLGLLAVAGIVLVFTSGGQDEDVNSEDQKSVAGIKKAKPKKKES